MAGAALPPDGGFAGPAWFGTNTSDFNALDFLVRQILAGKAFAALVKVISVTGGGVGAPPSVAVQPMVNQIDGFGNQTPHGTVYNLPCFRLQGGNSAMILDPVEGDVGLAVICDRDISTAKATGKVSGPGSWRQNSWADGCYFGSFLGATPLQYLRFLPNGISLVDANGNTIMLTTAGVTIVDTNGNSIAMSSSGIALTGMLVTVVGNLLVDGNIHATGTITP